MHSTPDVDTTTAAKKPSAISFYNKNKMALTALAKWLASTLRDQLLEDSHYLFGAILSILRLLMHVQFTQSQLVFNYHKENSYLSLLSICVTNNKKTAPHHFDIQTKKML